MENKLMQLAELPMLACLHQVVGREMRNSLYWKL